MSSQGLSASHSPLATAHQAEVERTALGLLQRPDIKLAHLQAKALFLADPVAMTPAGSRTLDQAVDECVLTAIYDTILSDVISCRPISPRSRPIG